MKFRKKPVVIEAFQLTRSARASNTDWPSWMHDAWQKHFTEPGALSCIGYPNSDGTDQLQIMTLEGLMRVGWDDWIIQGVKGELYACKPDIFEATYEPAGEQA